MTRSRSTRSAHLARRRLPAVTLAATLFVLSACGGGTTAPATPPPKVVPTGPNDVTVGNNVFSPAALTVAPGTRVTWTWNSCVGGDGYGVGQTCTPHSVTFDDTAGSSTQGDGSYSRLFATAGTFNYHCAVHGAAMSGKVVVQ